VPSAITIAKIAIAVGKSTDDFLSHIKLPEDQADKEIELRLKQGGKLAGNMAIGNLDYKAKKQLLKILRRMSARVKK
jgi:hypothetical protein